MVLTKISRLLVIIQLEDIKNNKHCLCRLSIFFLSNSIWKLINWSTHTCLSTQEWWKISITNACSLLTSFLFCWFFAVVVLLLLSYNIQERQLMCRHGASSLVGREEEMCVCMWARSTDEKRKTRTEWMDVNPNIDVYFFLLFFSLSLAS